MSGLIDSTEMYLRTLYELMEEGIPPLRARLVERLHISAPAASEATARLAQEDLVELRDDRTVHLTDKGLARATAVMRKHRLAEVLLIDVIGLDWALVHIEACRWEHVISDAVEQRLVSVLGDPRTCPHGNPIPAAASAATTEPHVPAPLTLLAAARPDEREVVVHRISELLQTDELAMRQLSVARVVPGARLAVRQVPAGVEVRLLSGGPEESELVRRAALLPDLVPAGMVAAATATRAAAPPPPDPDTAETVPAATAALVYVHET